MELEFKISPYQESMDIIAVYEKEEVRHEYFFLNRDFIITNCLADGINYDLAKDMEVVSLDDFNGYEVCKYLLPQFSKLLILEYTGVLTGKTGCCPYVRETISPGFTFIRWETFCYPIFFNEDFTLRQFLGTRLNIDITVIMPDEFLAVACAPEVSNQVEHGKRTQKFFSDRHGIAIAIAKYTVKEFSIGTFYLLGEIDSVQLEKTMIAAHNFMNEHFGIRDIRKRTNYAAIPNKLGSFATYITVFIDEVTFESVKTMNHILHEFVHLGWNVKADDETQSIRFFDEAFTSYFEMRLMEHLTKDNYRLAENIASYRRQLNSFDGNIPIIGFGKHRYGDLSYTIGAICLYELSELVGVEIFEEATKTFLQQYKDSLVNMEMFCNEYKRLCKHPELEQFLEDWIYSTKGPKSYIASYLS